MTERENTDIFSIRELEDVKKLLSEGRTTKEILNYIKYKNLEESVVNSIMEYLSKYKKKINKISTIFINAFYRKYGNTFYTMSLSRFYILLSKYKSKYNLTNEEYREVIKLFETYIYNKKSSNNSMHINTNMSRVLGFPIVEDNSNILMTNDDDYSHLQDIIRLYTIYKPQHGHLTIQTASYTNLDLIVTTGKYDPTLCDKYMHVNHLLVALFYPKISSLEERMLYSNIAGIITAKHNKEKIITKPDYELLHSLVTDPTDIVCDTISPIKDLKSRAELQIKLWENIYSLRSGKIYNSTVINFLTFIDKCKLSANDNPDLLFQNDIGVILRRLFSIFAYRPIIIYSIPVQSHVIYNPLAIPSENATVSALPYITFKIPIIQQLNPAGVINQINLEDSLNQVQLVFDNGKFIPKLISIINIGNEPIIFYIPRKIIKLPTTLIQPININNLTLSALHNNMLNIQPVESNIIMEIKTRDIQVPINIHLRSVISYHLNSQMMYEYISWYAKWNTIPGFGPYISYSYIYDPTFTINNPTRVNFPIYRQNITWAGRRNIGIFIDNIIDIAELLIYTKEIDK